MLSFEYAPTYKITSLKNKTSSDSVKIENMEKISLHHIIAVDIIYEITPGRLNVLIKMAGRSKSTASCKRKGLSGWLQNILSFYKSIKYVMIKKSALYTRNVAVLVLGADWEM